MSSCKPLIISFPAVMNFDPTKPTSAADSSVIAADRRRAVKTEESGAPRIDDTIRKALDHYFHTLGDQPPHALYDMVISAAERPLLSYVMHRYHHNVTHAAKALGITRNTLRKKLDQYGLIATDQKPSQSRSSR